MGTGVSGEAGELLDAIKKYVVYNKPIDLENVIEELGDLEFYMEKIRQNLGITREQTLVANIEKLGKRYANGYSDKAAQERADKLAEV
jgi:NTP pyrophosphatase (non-canonical NTP hydrolase)